MERLQWWLLLLSAVMFSMSGCATRADWQIWAGHPAHFASSNHLAFSAKSHPTTASITEADKEAAEREAWWGRLMPQEKPTAVAAALGVPEIVRHIGAMGIPMSYRVSRSEVLARYEDGPAVLLRFKRVGERIYGRIDASPSFLLVLERQ